MMGVNCTKWVRMACEEHSRPDDAAGAVQSQAMMQAAEGPEVAARACTKTLRCCRTETLESVWKCTPNSNYYITLFNFCSK
eukprot:1484038-Amphidinium_carterae.1